MKRPASRYPETCFPNRQQKILLAALLNSGETALQAWLQWKSMVDLDTIDYGTTRLMPLLFKKLTELGVQDPWMAKLRGIYRYTWAKNHRILHRVLDVMRQFQEVGIDTVLVKGGAMSLFVYRDYGLRYMDDLDLLVRLEQAPQAIEYLKKWGWKQYYTAIKPFIPSFHAVAFKDPQGLELDLHWHLITHCTGARDDEEFWRGIRAVQIEGVPTHVLHPTDQLLQTCVHGARWNEVSPIRWVADAVYVLRLHRDDIDWERLHDHARRLSLSVTLRETLSYLREHFDAPVPDRFFEALDRIPAPKWERREYENETSSRAWMSEFPVLWHRYHRSDLSRRYRFKPYGFLRYIQEHRGFERLSQVPAYLVRRFFQEAKKNLQGSKALSASTSQQIQPPSFR